MHNSNFDYRRNRRIKYKAGDRVRVRSWEDMAREFGVDENGDISSESEEIYPYFVKNMREYCGETFTVSQVDDGWYKLDGAEGVESWGFSDGMLEDAEPESEDSIKAEDKPREWSRADVLAEAARVICHDRNDEYGEPEDNFAVIAKLWNAFITARCAPPGTEIDIGPKEVAEMMALFKIGRLSTAVVPKPDSFIDCAGYIACAGEIAMRRGSHE